MEPWGMPEEIGQDKNQIKQAISINLLFPTALVRSKPVYFILL